VRRNWPRSLKGNLLNLETVYHQRRKQKEEHPNTIELETLIYYQN
jgi:hypothetical protein